MRIGFIDSVHNVLKNRLESAGMVCVDLTSFSEADIKRDIQNYEGLVIRSRFPLDKAFLSKASKLKFIARSGAGMENIDLPHCKTNNIQLFNAPEGNRNAVGEHALAMLLCLFNNINKGDAEIRSGIWDREGNRGVELDGKTIGLIGYGNNGAAFAKKLKGFDVKVLAYDKYKIGFGTDNVVESSMQKIFAEAEVISFHIPQNSETLFMVNKDYLNKFKNDIFVINLARGKIIDTTSLVDGLKSNKVKGACLDVLEFEKDSFENMFEHQKGIPDAFNYLLQSEKVLLSPHVGGWTSESYFKLSNVLADKILHFFS